MYQTYTLACTLTAFTGRHIHPYRLPAAYYITRPYLQQAYDEDKLKALTTQKSTPTSVDM